MKEFLRKGDLTFYNDSDTIYQQFLNGPIEPCHPLPSKTKTIQQIGNYTIKLDQCGIFGFSVWKDGKLLRDKIWSLNKILNITVLYQKRHRKEDVMRELEQEAAETIDAA